MSHRPGQCIVQAGAGRGCVAQQANSRWTRGSSHGPVRCGQAKALPSLSLARPADRKHVRRAYTVQCGRVVLPVSCRRRPEGLICRSARGRRTTTNRAQRHSPTVREPTPLGKKIQLNGMIIIIRTCVVKSIVTSTILYRNLSKAAGKKLLQEN